MRAVDLINPGEFALAIFTRGDHLVINPDGTGSTGYWIVDPNMVLRQNWIIIYYREDRTWKNQIYVGSPVDTIPIEVKGKTRQNIIMENIRPVGATDSTWPEFTEGGPNPVAYIVKWTIENKTHNKTKANSE